MLKKIFYLTDKKDILLSKEWPSLLNLWGIGFEALSSSRIKNNNITKENLFLCETRKDAFFV